MPVTFNQYLKMEANYPGLLLGSESWALETYVNVLISQIDFASDQHRLRENRALENSRDLEDSEIMGRLSQIDEAAEHQLPRYFLNTSIVPIWGLFESTVTDLSSYVSGKEGNRLSLKDLKANNFRDQAKKFFKAILDMPLPWSAQEQAQLKNLQYLRNLIAHQNGRYEDSTEEKRNEIERLVGSISGVTINHHTIVVSQEYVLSVVALVVKALNRLDEIIVARYSVPSVIPIGAKFLS